MPEKKPTLINRELSWLSFNERVLQEAGDPSVPLIERLKFLGIFSSNRDEFFRVRVATIRRLKKLGKRASREMDENPKLLLDQIMQKIVRQQDLFDEIYHAILKDLEKHNLFIVNEKQLAQSNYEFVRKYFNEQVLPSLVPIMLDHAQEFPWLKDRALYLFIRLNRTGRKNKFALMEIPADTLPRFVLLPDENKYVIMLDDIIRFCLDEVFYIFQYETAEAYTIKLTRDAELDIENDVSKSIIKKIAESIKRRKKGEPVRLEYDEQMPPDMLKYLKKKMKFIKDENMVPGGRYHNFVHFMNFPSAGKTKLCYEPVEQLSHPDLQGRKSILKVIREKDLLLSYPYQSFHHIIDLLREASIDPKVSAIQITLYRVAKNSKIVNTLINAAKNGKQVTAVVELQARFDEERNIFWSNRLQEEGVRVIFGVQGLKAHTKLLLITRMENNHPKLYAHIGTGNFNEETARLYCDHSLLTADKRITHEVARLFNFYSDNYKTGTYKHLLVAPFFMRKKLLSLIEKERMHAKKGQPAGIFLKLNNLVDQEVIASLYRASQEGVRIRIIVRGICSLVPGISGMSDHIEAISILDKYLEHARVFLFTNGGDEKYFISSADFMIRNFDFRSEVAVPVFDKSIQRELKDILEIQWRDHVKARVINEKQDNMYRTSESKTNVRAQNEIYEYLKSKSNRTKEKKNEVRIR